MKIKVEAVDSPEARAHAGDTQEDDSSEPLNAADTCSGNWSWQTGVVLKDEDDGSVKDYGNMRKLSLYDDGQRHSHDDDALKQHQEYVLEEDPLFIKDVKEDIEEQEPREEEEMMDVWEPEHLEIKGDVETRHQEHEEIVEVNHEQLQVKETDLLDIRGQEKDVNRYNRKRNGRKRQRENTYREQKQVDELYKDMTHSGDSSSDAEIAPRQTKQCKRRGTYSCPECNETFPSQASLSTHRSSHRLTCVVCDRRFKFQVELDGHMREHEGEKTPYWCDRCDKKYSTLCKLQSHRRTCGRFECVECGKVFVRKDYYTEHMVIHADSKRNTCEVCGKQFSSATNKRNHMVMHTDDMPFKCVVCDKGFNFQMTLNYHMKKHTGQIDRYTEELECDVCGKIIKGVPGLKTHMDIHKGKKDFECNVCGKRFTQASSRDGHERTHYNKTIRFNESLSKDQLKENVINSFDCSECLLSFTKERYLYEHLNHSHKLTSGVAGQATGTCPEFQCILCDSSFKSTAELNSHYLHAHCQVVESPTESNCLNTSTCADGVTSPSSRSANKVISLSSVPVDSVTCSDKQYGCNFCNKIVNSKTVTHHMRNHGERQFVCRVCGRTFSQMPNLKRHMTLHTSETPYPCAQCDKKFRTHEALKKHKTSHRGKEEREPVKKYGCDTCGKMFLDNYHLDRHKISHMKKYRCGYCKKSFVDVNIYEQHMRAHDSKFDSK